MAELEFIEHKRIMGISYQIHHQRISPDSWDDLSANQIREFGRTINMEADDQLKKYSLLYHFLKLPPRVFFKIPRGILDELFAKLSFLLDKCVMNTALIRSFFHRGILYIGPEDNLSTNVMIESGWMEQFFSVYHEHHREEDLDLLIATVYRPVHWWKLITPWISWEDRRIPFRMATVEKRAAKLKTLPKDLKQAIHLQLMGLRNSKAEQFPNVYTPRGGGDRFGWLGLMIDLAGDKFGDQKAIEMVPTDKVLVYLEKTETERLNN